MAWARAITPETQAGADSALALCQALQLDARGLDLLARHHAFQGFQPHHALGGQRSAAAQLGHEECHCRLEGRPVVGEHPDQARSGAVRSAIDMGIARFVTMNDGRFVAPLDSFRKHEIRLAISRKRKGGKGIRPRSSACTPASPTAAFAHPPESSTLIAAER